MKLKIKIEPGNSISITAIEAALCRLQCGQFLCPEEQQVRLYINKHFGSEKRKCKSGKMAEWLIKIRTIVFDEYIGNLIANGDINGVLNLGAGLDFRFLRLKLPDAFKWIECDNGEIVTIKRDILNNIQYFSNYILYDMDITNLAKIEKIANDLSKKSKWLVLTEGLLCYFSEDQVTTLARFLSRLEAICYWAFDLNSPWAVSNMNARQKTKFNRNSFSVKFAPEKGNLFFADPPWKILQSTNMASYAKSKGFPIPQPWSILLKLSKRQIQDEFEKACSITLMKKVT
jgi:O-methyltransferase involved in polyketide biosynthesis